MPMSDVRSWVERQRESHAREDIAEARRMAALSAEERLTLLASLCASAFKVLEGLSPEKRREALEWRQPLPPSSVAALARLRREYKGPPRGR